MLIGSVAFQFFTRLLTHLHSRTFTHFIFSISAAKIRNFSETANIL